MPARANGLGIVLGSSKFSMYIITNLQVVRGGRLWNEASRRPQHGYRDDGLRQMFRQQRRSRASETTARRQPGGARGPTGVACLSEADHTDPAEGRAGIDPRRATASAHRPRLDSSLCRPTTPQRIQFHYR